MLLLKIIDIILTHNLSLIYTCDLYTLTCPSSQSYVVYSHALNLTDIASLIKLCCHSQGHVFSLMKLYTVCFTHVHAECNAKASQSDCHKSTVTPGGKIFSNRFTTEKVTLHCIYRNVLTKVNPQLETHEVIALLQSLQSPQDGSASG